MKILKLIVVLGITVSAVFFVHACQKNVEKNNQKSENLKLQQIPPKSISVSCAGEGCSSGGDCKATFGSDWDTFSCCEGCHLEIILTIGGEIEPIDAETSTRIEDLDFYSETAYSYISENYNESYEIKGVAVGFNDLNHYVTYFFTTEDEENGSVLVFMAPGGGDKITIDCSGSCTNTSESCVETATIHPDGTIDVKCGCEGKDCKMVID